MSTQLLTHQLTHNSNNPDCGYCHTEQMNTATDRYNAYVQLAHLWTWQHDFNLNDDA